MSRLSVPTVAQLAAFADKAEDDFTAFAETALTQGTLLFELATCLTAMPTAGTAEYDLAANAILDMSNALYLAKPYQAAVHSPFSSETIGSYSYSKMAAAISQGFPTSVPWFDSAVQLLGICTNRPVVEGSAITVFETDGIETDSTGRRYLDSPDLHDADYPPAFYRPDMSG